MFWSLELELSQKKNVLEACRVCVTLGRLWHNIRHSLADFLERRRRKEREIEEREREKEMDSVRV